MCSILVSAKAVVVGSEGWLEGEGLEKRLYQVRVDF
jgi:hypothetical protein